MSRLGDLDPVDVLNLDYILSKGDSFLVLTPARAFIFNRYYSPFFAILLSSMSSFSPYIPLPVNTGCPYVLALLFVSSSAYNLAVLFFFLFS